MNSSYRWINCTSWELDFFGLPHNIPWPTEVEEAVAHQQPFELEHLLAAIGSMGSEATQPWTGFQKAAAYFEDLTEALEDSDLGAARTLLTSIEEAHPGTSFRLFHQGYIARQEGRLDLAIEFYQQAAALTPGVPEIWNNLAMVLGLSQRRDDAIAAFRKTLEINPKDTTALDGLAQLRELVKLMRDSKDPSTAVWVDVPTFRTMAAQQIETLSTDPDQLLTYGEELFRAGLVPEVGMSALERVLQIRPEDPRTLFAVATGYRTLGRLEEARVAAQKLADLVPDNAEVFFHLAQCCNVLGDPAAERSALERTLALNPNFQPALGIWFDLKPNEHDPVKEQQLVAFAQERTSWMAYVLASALCRQRGDFKRALRWADAAVAMAPDLEEPFLHLITIVGDAKDIAKLANDIKPKVQSGKFSKRVDWNFAHVLHQVGLQSDAVSVLRKAMAAPDAADDFKAACSTTLEAWNGLLTGTNVALEVHSSGVLLRDILLRVEDDDGGVILTAGTKLPGQGVFPWRANGAETSVTLQQGQSGTSDEPRILGDFRVRGIQPAPQGQPTTIECHIMALPDGLLHFRAAQNGKRLGVGWAPARS